MDARIVLLIGFDACLMGSIETAAALAPYADYLIASEETEPWEGWNYAFLGQLSADQGGEEIGSMIVEDYRTFYTEKYEEYPYLTPILSLTCIDLKQIGCVEEAMDALFTAISADIQTEHYAEIVTARHRSVHDRLELRPGGSEKLRRRAFSALSP